MLNVLAPDPATETDEDIKVKVVDFAYPGPEPVFYQTFRWRDITQSNLPNFPLEGPGPTSVTSLWAKLAKYSLDYPHVYCMDIKNEPHSAPTAEGDVRWQGRMEDAHGPGFDLTWAKWGNACKVVSKAILAANPHVCIAIAGLHDKPSATFPGPDGTCWGAGFSTMKPEDVEGIPIDRIVWTPHQYGSLAAKVESTPDNSFRSNWGFLSETAEPWRNQCVMIGEWGFSLISRKKGALSAGKLMDPVTHKDEVDAEEAHINLMTAYMAEHQMDSYYFALNNSSADTAPLLDFVSKGSKTYAINQRVAKAMDDATPRNTVTKLTFPMPPAAG
jgi:aryl-phospho-beta-D-glucosidase BglC (GH1 family)